MNKTLLKKYTDLMGKAREQAVFSQAEGILQWDMRTKMPPGGGELRSQELALLSGIGHRMNTSPELEKLLKGIEQHADYGSLTLLQKRNIHLIRKDFDEQTALPEELVVEMRRQSAIANNVWRKAKAANKWQMFRPELEKNVELAKRKAGLLMKVKKTATPYDALLDGYEPEMPERDISKLFGELQKGLETLLGKVMRSPKQPDVSILERKVPVDIQRRIATALAETIQYDVTSDKAKGRIDETEHPFTVGNYDDVRITTHFYEDRFAYAVQSVMHEAGHALYHLNLNPDWKFQPVGHPCSMGLNESQSRTVQNIIGKSEDFWVYFLPRLKKLTGDTLRGVSVERFVHALNGVAPSKIRVEADEVTYGLHIIVRFNIERDLFAGKIAVKDLPEIWNASYKKSLGIDIETDSEGVMQDTHWSGGSFGYFPSYTLGDMYSAQLLGKMESDIPHWRKELRKGNFSPVKQWLADKVHSQGQLYDPSVLIKKITGSKLTAKPYLAYLNSKYSKLYGF